MLVRSRIKPYLILGSTVIVIAGTVYFWGLRSRILNLEKETSVPQEAPTVTPEQPSRQTAVKVFFGNSAMNPNAEDCSLVYPVFRNIAATETVGEASLEELLKGPTEADKQQGYYTSLNSGVKLQSLTIENGVAKADFDPQLQYQVGGSCRVQAIRAEITQTLKQFPTVNEVFISVNGETELILQP